jgi:hypothetical protein
MKMRNISAKFVVQVMVVAAAILGVYIADKTYHYEALIRGVLGLVIMYHVYRTLWSSRNDEEPFLFKKNIKYVFMTFFYAIVFYWALQEVFGMILLFVEAF